MKIIITESQYELLNEQLGKSIINEQNSSYGFWDNVIDFFLPGTPVKDGRDLLSKFDGIIKNRIEYNKKNKLPLDTLTPEEKSFREKILKATPNYGYPGVLGLSKIIQDINQGKNIQPEEFKNYTNVKKASDYGGGGKKTGEEIKQMMGSREELKRMWLGLDEPGDELKGLWIKSEFKPKESTNPNAVYYKPKDIPKLTPQQFDELYDVILKTRLPNGKFPGGNSSVLFNSEFKFIDNSDRDKIRGDLGHFKFGVGEENSKKFISVYDEWDLMPPSAKVFGVDVQKYGKTPLIYYRIYK